MIQIRSICDADIDTCLQIYNYYIENTTVTFEETPLGADAFRERVHAISAHFPYLVALEDGVVIGYAYLDVFNSRSAYRYTADLSVYLAPSSCAHGTGTKLVDAVLGAGKAQGIRSVISIVTGENRVSARFHEKNGFSLVGTLHHVGYKHNKWLDVMYYQKTL